MSLNNFGIVGPSLYRSAQPDVRGIADLKKLDVDCVIRLNESGHIGIDTESDLFGFAVEPCFIETYSVNLERWKQIALMLDTALRGGQTVLVHCEHGMDRTGGIIGAWQLLYQGWTLAAVNAERKEFMLPGLLGDVEYVIDHEIELALGYLADNR